MHKLISVDDFDNCTWLILILSLVVFMQLVFSMLLDERIFRTGLQTIMLVIAILSFLEIRRRPETRVLMRMLLYGIAAALFAKAAITFAGLMQVPPREWDFLVFFLDAKVTAAGLNLYDPANFIAVAAELELDVSQQFREEIIETAFWYPPWTALLFLPLSAFSDVNVANWFWLSATAVTLVIACVMLSRLFKEPKDSARVRFSGLDAVVLAFVVVLSLPFRGLGLMHGQTVGLFACLAIATILLQNSKWKGFSAALSVVVKPLGIIPASVLLIGKYWVSVVVGIGTGLVVIIISVAVLGADDWISYVGMEFAAEMPAHLYSEPGNRSLLATINRVLGFQGIPWHAPGIVAIYAFLALAFAVPSVWLASKTMRTDFRTAYCLMLVMGLIVYPGTGYPYSVILTVPFAVELWNQVQDRQRYTTIVAFLATASALLHWDLIAANVFVWAVLCWRSLRIMRHAESPSATHPQSSPA